jgi:hypothetical protein
MLPLCALSHHAQRPRYKSQGRHGIDQGAHVHVMRSLDRLAGGDAEAFPAGPARHRSAQQRSLTIDATVHEAEIKGAGVLVQVDQVPATLGWAGTCARTAIDEA